MDAELKGALEKLAEALHRAIEKSPDVEDALSRIRTEGYQAFLLLEVTVALGQPSSGLSLEDVAHALADDDDDAVDDADDASDDAEDPDDLEELEVAADDDAADDAVEADAESAQVTEIVALERRVVQLPVVMPGSPEKTPQDLDAAINADDLEFLKSIRIRLD